MTEKQVTEKRELLGELEEKLINEISNTNNDDLMNLFLDWQNCRKELNENFMSQLDNWFKDE